MRKKKRSPHLSKYDAPLSIQYKKGMSGFINNIKTPYNLNTMQYREWQRGWNDAYAYNLNRVHNANKPRARSKEVYGRKKQYIS